MKPYYYTPTTNDAPKWDTLEEAQAEAERYAAKHPGRAFEILRCVGIAQTSKASTFWMDGEEPPEKPRYRELEDGEVIQMGDEWLVNGNWRKRQYRIGEEFCQRQHAPHRRPL